MWARQEVRERDEEERDGCHEKIETKRERERVDLVELDLTTQRYRDKTSERDGRELSISPNATERYNSRGGDGKRKRAPVRGDDEFENLSAREGERKEDKG